MIAEKSEKSGPSYCVIGRGLSADVKKKKGAVSLSYVPESALHA